MQGAKIAGIIVAVIAVGVGVYFLLRKGLPNLFGRVEEQLEEPKSQESLQSMPLKLSLKSPAHSPLKLAYQNTEEWDIIRDMDGRISKVVIHRRVMGNG